MALVNEKSHLQDTSVLTERNPNHNLASINQNLEAVDHRWGRLQCTVVLEKDGTLLCGTMLLAVSGSDGPSSGIEMEVQY